MKFNLARIALMGMGIGIMLPGQLPRTMEIAVGAIIFLIGAFGDFN
jgi:hypothetical protein